MITSNSDNELLGNLEKASFDLIVLDQKLPDVLGIDLLRQLREMDKWKDVPVIFITSHANPDVHSNIEELKVADIQFKPFSPSVLIRKIKECL